jgi:hypothetical protein
MVWNWDDEQDLNPDVGFIYRNVADIAEQWPLSRVLIWARPELNIFISGVYEMEAKLIELRKLKDDDPVNFGYPAIGKSRQKVLRALRSQQRPPRLFRGSQRNKSLPLSSL